MAPKPAQNEPDITSTAAPKRQTRRYTLSAPQRAFATDQLVPAYLEQMDRNIDAMATVIAKNGTPELPLVVAQSLHTQFTMQKERAQDIANILEHGRDDDNADD